MKYLPDYTEQARSELFEKTNAFFAFNNEQFNEGIIEGKKYFSLGAGLYCPKDSIDELLDGMELIANNAVKQDVEENGAKAIIKREFFNHETQITCDTTDALRAIDSHIKTYPDLFTNDLIEEVFRDCFNIASEKDLY